MYLNGALVATNTGMTLRPSSMGNTTLNFLGDSQFGADPIFNGYRIHSRALTEAEVLAAAAPEPGVPTSLNALAGDAMVMLDWTAADYATSYQVKRATTSGGPFITVASGITATSFSDAGMPNDVTYFYMVTAMNPQGEGAESNMAAATPNHLRVHLKFDESSGTAAADSTGHGWSGPPFNAPVYGEGKFGNALHLASSSSQYVALPTGIVDDMTAATIMLWVRIGSVATWQRVFDFGTGTSNYLFLTTHYDAGEMPTRCALPSKVPPGRSR